YEDLRGQVRFALEHGVQAVLIAPMIVGVSNFNALCREFPSLAWLAHPALGGHQIRPSLLLGKLFRLFGADAVIFPNHGGRFSYSREECQAIAGNLRAPIDGMQRALPVPAGGMSVARVPELVGEYGSDVVLLIGGSLLMAREQLAERSREFVMAAANATLTGMVA
ncbi:MAG: ribulose 1,5-bisphosphate carboxylase, partial [Burkholderiaceae bacterium]